jgi:hypothetical protein
LHSFDCAGDSMRDIMLKGAVKDKAIWNGDGDA